MRTSLAPARLLVVIAMWVMFALSVSSMKGDAPTFDEQGFLVRGLAYLRGEANGGNRHMRVGHPLGLNALNAALLVNDATVRLPSDDPSWLETSFHRPAELFLWEIGNDVAHVMFLARLPTIWLGLLLAAVGGRWAAEMTKQRRNAGAGGASPAVAGIVTLLLLTFDPNIMAHTRLVTTDLGLAAAAALAGFTLWRFMQRLTWGRAALAGVGLGLLLNTKFTALLFLPFFAVLLVLTFVRYRRETRASRLLWPILLMGVVAYPLIALLTLWAGHGFQVGPLDSPLPVIGQVDAAVPLSHYLDQLLDIGNRLAVSTPSFLLGQYSDSGWWYYFPVAFLLKTPLPVLILLGGSVACLVVRLVRRPSEMGPMWFDLAALLLPPAGFFAIALTTSVNLGYRHLLPILPFLYVYIGVVAGGAFCAVAGRFQGWRVRLTGALLAWLIIVSIWIYPHYLAFFNLLIGGPENGWRALVDSNLDWGQDLARLAEWLAAKEIDPVWLSYFGEARPDYYGIGYRGLDSVPPRLMNPLARSFYPPDPAPGWYAISATTLQGVHFADHDLFAFFRARRPADKIGRSIFLYEQPARGEPVDLLLGNVQIDEIEPRDFAFLDTNDVTLRWFDPQSTVILPDAARDSWLALGDQPLHPLLLPYLGVVGQTPAAVGEGYTLFSLTLPPFATAEEEIALHLNEAEVRFTGAPTFEHHDALSVVTSWRQIGTPRPLQIFIHVRDESGALVAQWDGLDAAWEGWWPGDTLIHAHEIALTGVAPGDYRVVTGLYDPENLQRWRSAAGADSIELGTITVP